LKAVHNQSHQVINVDKNAAYLKAIDELKPEKELSQPVELRQNKYLNNIVEPDPRGINRLVNPGICFGSFHPARLTLKESEMSNMIRKRQIEGVGKAAVTAQVKFIAQVFGVAA